MSPVAMAGTAVASAWAPPATSLVMPTVFPDDIEVQVFTTSAGATLVAAIELVSPGNKDRPDTCRAFAAKCVAYLTRGIGLIVVDIVTNRLANLHNEIIGMLGHGEPFLLGPAVTGFALDANAGTALLAVLVMACLLGAVWARRLGRRLPSSADRIGSACSS